MTEPALPVACPWCRKTPPIGTRTHRVAVEGWEYTAVCGECFGRLERLASQQRMPPAQRTEVEKALRVRVRALERELTALFDGEMPARSRLAARLRFAGLVEEAETVQRLAVELKRLRDLASTAAAVLAAIDARSPDALAAAVEALRRDLRARDTTE